MADTIKIKRSTVTATPTSLAAGELAYSEVSGNFFYGRVADGVPVKIGGATDVQKLNGIEAGAQVNTVDSVNGFTGTVQLGANNLTDVTISTPLNTQVLVYDGTVDNQWENRYLTKADISDFNGADYAPAVHTHVIADITDFTDNSTNWNTAFGWGDHALAGYAAAVHTHVKADITDFTETAYVHTTGTETVGGDKTFSNNIVISGNLTVSGTTTTINTETLTVDDNIVVLNNNYAGSTPTENGGIEVERGTLTNASLIWDETADVWKAGVAGSEVEISLAGHTQDISTITGFTDNSTNWDTAFSWGNHATQGYLTAITGESIKDLSDVHSAMVPAEGEVLTYTVANGWTSQATATVLDQFTQLTDTPANYTAAAGYFVKVNGTATGLEFAASIDGGTF